MVRSFRACAIRQLARMVSEQSNPEELVVLNDGAAWSHEKASNVSRTYRPGFYAKRPSVGYERSTRRVLVVVAPSFAQGCSSASRGISA